MEVQSCHSDMTFPSRHCSLHSEIRLQLNVSTNINGSLFVPWVGVDLGKKLTVADSSIMSWTSYSLYSQWSLKDWTIFVSTDYWQAGGTYSTLRL